MDCECFKEHVACRGVKESALDAQCDAGAADVGPKADLMAPKVDDASRSTVRSTSITLAVFAAIVVRSRRESRNAARDDGCEIEERSWREGARHRQV
jgi:hypothetical protein